MKFFKIIIVFFILISIGQACKQNSEADWKVEIKDPVTQIDMVDISGEYYNPAVSLAEFKQKYPWFQGTVSDADFDERRKDQNEIKIYKTAISKIDQKKLKTDLENLFSHVKYYFPQFSIPKVLLYSSALQGVQDPIFYQAKENMLFIDVTGFMGENNPYYQGLEMYFQRSMNPQNILPKVSRILAEQFVPFNTNQQKFVDQLIYQGKLMMLQDAFLPNEPDYLKINYTPDQYDWSLANEVNIWDFFVENNLVFSDDARLSERFIQPGPFSKFYTAVDNESSPQIGIFTGWQICKEFFYHQPDVSVQDFLKMDAQTIFNKAQYKPKQTEQ